VRGEAARRPDGEDAVLRSPVYISGACANCDSLAVTVQTPLFCSQRCRQAAELVRYVRACRRDGRDQLPDVKEAIRTKMAMVLGGGYPERERQVPPEIRAEVFNRAGGLCENCGRSLDFDRSTRDPDAIPTIHHVVGNSNDVANLKSFCRRCNLGDAQSRFVPVVPGSPQEKMAAELVTRWSSIEPLRLCDDERRWKSTWSELSRSARELISSRPPTG
jgi:5-methylcytosine-specific restriction endonuclease McrA